MQVFQNLCMKNSSLKIMLLIGEQDLQHVGEKSVMKTAQGVTVRLKGASKHF